MPIPSGTVDNTPSNTDDTPPDPADTSHNLVVGAGSPDPDSGAANPDSGAASPDMPDYKGAPLDAERGPGLGCFWFQVVLLVLALILTPISVWLSAPSWLSAALLILSLILLFFVGQTMIFLLRLVAADRRTRRRPLAPTARQTVGQLEDVSDQDDATPDEPLT